MGSALWELMHRSFPTSACATAHRRREGHQSVGFDTLRPTEAAVMFDPRNQQRLRAAMLASLALLLPLRAAVAHAAAHAPAAPSISTSLGR